MRHSAGVIGALLVAIGLIPPCAFRVQAQVVAAPSDAGTAVAPAGSTFNITGGTTTGTNLFHSFRQFDLTSLQTANFLPGAAIQNILGRIVGGSPSVINGLIQVTGSNANLYLMNPAGIVFGANASLNVPGSFLATTASGIRLGAEWFNAVGGNNYAALGGVPNALGFAMNQPGAIVNAANLAVGSGQNLTLVGGTVVNTGTLSAPGGTITVAAVPGERLVRVNQEGSVLSLDLPLESRATINPLPYTPQTLPQLLTGSPLGNATGVTLTNGVVTLTGSGIPVTSGDVVVKGVTARTATLTASHNLTLVESQIQTTADLNLRATHTVQIRDSATTPTVVQAGGNLVIQGDRAVDLMLLNHSTSGLVSGRDMVLRSTAPIQGDADYFVGGNLRFEQLDGSAGNVFSPYDPIILALGDVSLGSYTGASLHILAGGSVTIGNVTITLGGTAATTINPANAVSYNGNPANTFATLAPIIRENGTPLYINPTPTLDAAGEVQRIPVTTGPLSNQLVIDGRNPTLDVRAGIDWTQLGGLPGNLTIGVAPTLSTATSANITINSIQVTGISGGGGANQTGTIYLTNRYYPNLALAGGTIEVTGLVPGGFNSPSIVCGGCSFTNTTLGTIAIDSRSSILVGNVQAFSAANVAFSAVSNITTGRIIAQGPEAGTGSVPLRTSVALQSATGNIRVSTIDAGANGIDIQTAGLFQAVGVFDANFSLFQPSAPFIFPSTPGTPLGDFLISRGISPPPAQTFVALDESYGQNTTLLARTISNTITPITIRYGDGSRRLINDTFRNGVGVNRVVVDGGNAGFVVGSQVIGRIVPGSDPVVSSPAFGVFEAVTPANFLVIGGRGVVVRNDRFSALSFGSPSFPADFSGSVGSISFSGIDATLYGDTSTRSFPPITNPGGGGAGGGGSDGSGGQPSFNPVNVNGVERDIAQRSQSDVCSPSGATAAAPGTNTRSNNSPRSTNPCTPTSNDAQILQILGDTPPR